MTVAAGWTLLKGIGAAAGLFITFATFFGLVSKRPRAALRRIIREESENANEGIKAELEEIKGEVASAKQNDIVQLRNTITHIYFKYKDQKKIPHYEKENVLSLYERYDALGGNHYVRNIISEIEGWEEIL